VAHEFGGKVRFVEENYGASELAKRFGVTRYPAIFVDDVLVATPKDFGFYGKGEGSGDGRYTPFPSGAGEERFRADLKREIGLILAGRKDAARAQAPAPDTQRSARLPEAPLVALDGKPIQARELLGRPVVVELWATWCPPCRATLSWLGDLQRRQGNRFAVVALAVQSDEAAVRGVAAELRFPFLWAIGTPDWVRSLGDVSAVPTLLVFDRQGRAAATFYGAPPTLHAEAEARLAALLR
jgi:thiol-disulfide isomerase/thioredoxin